MGVFTRWRLAAETCVHGSRHGDVVGNCNRSPCVVLRVSCACVAYACMQDLLQVYKGGGRAGACYTPRPWRV